MIVQVDTYEQHFRETIPLFQNDEFITLCRNYGQASKEQKNVLYKDFGEFDIGPEEQLSLKPGIDSKEWRALVNYHKMNSFEFMCVHAVIDLETKLDEQGSLPIDALNYMAQRNVPTGAMEIYNFHTIEKYHPRGAEMRQRWKEYCDTIYGHK